MSEKAIRELQERVTVLEKEVQLLRAQTCGNGEPWWKQISGIFKDDPAFEEVKEFIRKEREEDYRKVNEEIDRLEAAEREAAAKKKRGSRGKSRRATSKGGK